MRELKTHIVEGDSANHQLEITVRDEPGSGGACHSYCIHKFNAETNPSTDGFTSQFGDFCVVLFQNGPIKEVGVNGVTHEALLAILIDRLEKFQAGPFAGPYNGEALMHLRTALDCLQQRTRERITRGVEGTHAK